MDDHHQHVQDHLEKVNLGDMNNPRLVYISSLLDDILKIKLKEMLNEFKDYFSWSYEDMSRLDKKLVEHHLPIKENLNRINNPQGECPKK